MGTKLIYPKTVLSTLADGNLYYDLGNPPHLTDMEVLTIWAWVYIDAYGFTFARAFSCGDNTLELCIDGGVGADTARVFFECVHSPTTERAHANAGSQLSTGEWSFIAATWSIGNAPTLYQGEIDEQIHEPTYTTQQVGSGTRTSDAANNKWLLSRPTGTNNRNLDGAIASIGLIRRVLSREELQSIKNRPRMVRDQLAYWVMGHDGDIGRVKDFSPYRHDGVLGGTDALTPTISIPVAHEIPVKTNFALADPLPDTRVLEVPQSWKTQPPSTVPLDLSHPLLVGVTGFWRLDGSPDIGRDEIHGNVGTATGTFRPRMFEGIRGNDFNRGATEYIDMNDSATLDYTMGTGDWTIDMLFRCETNNARMISSGGSTDSTEGFTLMVKSDNTVELEVSNGTSRWISAVTAAVTLNEWHHIIASIDRDVGWFIMIDGVIAASGTDTDANNIDGTTDLFIGARSAGAIDYWDGQLARTLLYKRAMSHEQASGMMSNPWQIFKPQDLHVPIEYEELTFDSTKEDRLFKIPQKRTKQP